MFVGHPNISNQSWHAYEYKHMNTQETILQLEDLKLKGMAECYKGLQALPVNEWPTLDLFVARLAEAERRRLLDEGRAPVMLYFDLIGMKYYNRQYGFAQGDKLLRDVGQILARVFGERVAPDDGSAVVHARRV